MNRDRKNILIWIMFGIYLGTFIARAIKDVENTGTFDWVLILMGMIVGLIHYLPDKEK